MIQHTYDVQTFDDGNKIIRPALSNEYEALLGCLIDFPDLMERSVDIVIDLSLIHISEPTRRN